MVIYTLLQIPFLFLLSVFAFHSGSRRKLSSLAIYTEEDSKFDMSDLTPVVSDVNDSSDNKTKTNVSKRKKTFSSSRLSLFNNFFRALLSQYYYVVEIYVYEMKVPISEISLFASSSLVLNFKRATIIRREPVKTCLNDVKYPQLIFRK